MIVEAYVPEYNQDACTQTVLEVSRGTAAVMARARRLHALKRMAEHTVSAGDILRARMGKSSISTKLLEDFDQLEGQRAEEEKVKEMPRIA